MTRIWNARKYDEWYDTAVGAYVLAREQNLLMDAVRGPRVLDAGCGTGRMLRALHEKGFETVGLEPDKDMAEFARRVNPEVDIVQARLEDALSHGLTGPFDTVILNTVLPFAEDPAALMKAASSLLAPGGLLLVGELHPEALWNRWRKEHNGAFADLHFFAPCETATLAGGADLEFVRMSESVRLPAMDMLERMCLGNTIGKIRKMVASDSVPSLWQSVLRPLMAASLLCDAQSMEKFMPESILQFMEKVVPGPGAYYLSIFRAR